MKRVTLTFRKTVNWLQQEGRVVEAYHVVPLDEQGTVKQETVECDSARVSEFCIQICAADKVRAIPLDLLYNILIEEV